MSTCHANSPVDGLRRLEVMVLSAGLDLPLAAVRDQITSGLDLIVQVARVEGGARRVVSVGEVVDPPTSAPRIRSLAGPAGLHDLPERPGRTVTAGPPDRRWCR